MEAQHAADDQSHYEISLTAGQAFLAFVLMLLSLAASFAFGLMIGKGQADDRLVVRSDMPAVKEAALLAKKDDGAIVELGVADDDFVERVEEPKSKPPAKAAARNPLPVVIDEPEVPSESGTPDVVETAADETAARAAQPRTPRSATDSPSVPPRSSTERVPHYAQLLSTSDQKSAEGLAAKLIDGGFNSAYVERGTTEKGAVYRVRVRFESETEARASEPKLREFSKEVWITKR